MNFLVRLACACLLPVLPLPAAAQDTDAETTTAVAAEAVAPEEQPTLADLLWIARPIVVFADTANDPRFIQQMTMLEERPADLEDRRVVVLTDTDHTTREPIPA